MLCGLLIKYCGRFWYCHAIYTIPAFHALGTRIEKIPDKFLCIQWRMNNSHLVFINNIIGETHLQNDKVCNWFLFSYYTINKLPTNGRRPIMRKEGWSAHPREFDTEKHIYCELFWVHLFLPGYQLSRMQVRGYQSALNVILAIWMGYFHISSIMGLYKFNTLNSMTRQQTGYC